MRWAMSGRARTISRRQASERGRTDSVPFSDHETVAARASDGPEAIVHAKRTFASVVG